MIITFSAAQGQGKSTFIKDISTRSKMSSDMTIYPTKSARTIIESYGQNLQDIYANKNTLCNFQLDVLKLHTEIFNYSYNTKYLLVERSFIDILTFSVLNLGRFNDLSSWLDDFESLCLENQSKIGLTVKLNYYLKPKYDGVRPVNRQFNEAYDAYLERLFSLLNLPLLKIFSKSRIDRVEEFDKMFIEEK